eukprot:TRINITY_DN3825_c0_g3_i1.p1 TRINITY_DN3825_c0_g3~~TRINITY_DN3825_c0_g3_i1.p1  ORF type:complete len:1290 (+),score=277.57 TRINITY_DN3825_c0_g3_i1:16-3885(+)
MEEDKRPLRTSYDGSSQPSSLNPVLPPGPTHTPPKQRRKPIKKQKVWSTRTRRRKKRRISEVDDDHNEAVSTNDGEIVPDNSDGEVEVDVMTTTDESVLGDDGSGSVKAPKNKSKTRTTRTRKVTTKAKALVDADDSLDSASVPTPPAPKTKLPKAPSTHRPQTAPARTSTRKGGRAAAKQVQPEEEKEEECEQVPNPTATIKRKRKSIKDDVSASATTPRQTSIGSCSVPTSNVSPNKLPDSPSIHGDVTSDEEPRNKKRLRRAESDRQPETTRARSPRLLPQESPVVRTSSRLRDKRAAKDVGRSEAKPTVTPSKASPKKKTKATINSHTDSSEDDTEHHAPAKHKKPPTPRGRKRKASKEEISEQAEVPAASAEAEEEAVPQTRTPRTRAKTKHTPAKLTSESEIDTEPQPEDTAEEPTTALKKEKAAPKKRTPRARARVVKTKQPLSDAEPEPLEPKKQKKNIDEQVEEPSTVEEEEKTVPQTRTPRTRAKTKHTPAKLTSEPEIDAEHQLEDTPKATTTALKKEKAAPKKRTPRTRASAAKTKQPLSDAESEDHQLKRKTSKDSTADDEEENASPTKRTPELEPGPKPKPDVEQQATSIIDEATPVAEQDKTIPKKRTPRTRTRAAKTKQPASETEPEAADQLEDHLPKKKTKTQVEEEETQTAPKRTPRTRAEAVKTNQATSEGKDGQHVKKKTEKQVAEQTSPSKKSTSRTRTKATKPSATKSTPVPDPEPQAKQEDQLESKAEETITAPVLPVSRKARSKASKSTPDSEPKVQTDGNTEPDVQHKVVTPKKPPASPRSSLSRQSKDKAMERIARDDAIILAVPSPVKIDGLGSSSQSASKKTTVPAKHKEMSKLDRELEREIAEKEVDNTPPENTETNPKLALSAEPSEPPKKKRGRPRSATSPQSEKKASPPKRKRQPASRGEIADAQPALKKRNVTREASATENGVSYRASFATSCGGREENQDMYMVPPSARAKRTAKIPIFGVLDGHGSMGRKCALEAARLLSLYIPQNYDVAKAASPEDQIVDIEGDGEADTDNPADTEVGHIKEAINKSLQETQNYLLRMSEIDDVEYGTTVVLAAVTEDGSTLVLGNVGDSRAVLFRRESMNDDTQPTARPKTRRSVALRDRWIEVVCTNDQRPAREDERARIDAGKGQVVMSRFGDTLRVIPKEDFIPRTITIAKGLGLAMTRALGHVLLSQCGVSADPEFFVAKLQSADKLILACDGVWDMLTPQEAIGVVQLYAGQTPKAAAQALVDEAVLRWGQQRKKADNCTAVVVYFD